MKKIVFLIGLLLILGVILIIGNNIGGYNIFRTFYTTDERKLEYKCLSFPEKDDLSGKLIVEIFNPNDKPVLIDELDLVVEYTTNIPYKDLFSNYVSFAVLPNDKTVICFNTKGNNIDESTNIEFRASTINMNNENNVLLDKVDTEVYEIKTVYEGNDVVLAFNNNTNFQIKDLMGCIVFYYEDKIVDCETFYSSLNLIDSRESFFVAYSPSIKYDRLESYFIRASYNKKASTASKYISCKVINKEENRMLLEIQNTSDFPIQISGISFLGYDELNNLCRFSTPIGSMYTIMGKSKVVLEKDSRFDKELFKCYRIEPVVSLNGYSRHDNRDKITYKIEDNKVYFDVVNESDYFITEFGYSFVFYRNNEIVDFVLGYTSTSEYDIKNGISIETDKDFDRIEVGTFLY